MKQHISTSLSNVVLSPALLQIIMWRSVCRQTRVWCDLPFSKGRISAPKADWQSDHKEGMSSEVRSDSKVTIESWSSYLILHPGKIGRLPSDQGQHLLAQVVSPFRQSALVCKTRGISRARGAREAAESMYSDQDSLTQHREHRRLWHGRS